MRRRGMERLQQLWQLRWPSGRSGVHRMNIARLPRQSRSRRQHPIAPPGHNRERGRGAEAEQRRKKVVGKHAIILTRILRQLVYISGAVRVWLRTPAGEDMHTHTKNTRGRDRASKQK